MAAISPRLSGRTVMSRSRATASAMANISTTEPMKVKGNRTRGLPMPLATSVAASAIGNTSIAAEQGVSADRASAATALAPVTARIATMISITPPCTTSGASPVASAASNSRPYKSGSRDRLTGRKLPIAT